MRINVLRQNNLFRTIEYSLICLSCSDDPESIGRGEFMIKYTNQFLLKLEEMIGESDYILRYEKGNFKSGYCVLKDQKIMIVNKFYTTEGKINALLDIVKITDLDTSKFSEKSQKLFDELQQTPVSN